MRFFHYQNGRLHAEDSSLEALAEEYGTPLYIYSQTALESAFLEYQRALGDYENLICYSVKANSNIAVLNVLARLGSGFDIVSGGELERVLRAGGEAKKIVFSGVGKSREELLAGLRAGIACFNIESEMELEELRACAAETGITAPVAVRVNPNIDIKTHPHIATGLSENKFGVPLEEASELCLKIERMREMKLMGVDCHIGSQCLDLEPVLQAIDCLRALSDQLHAAGAPISHVNLGGGLGVNYQDEQPPSISEYCKAVTKRLQGSGLRLLLEPGRSIAASAGILLTRVRYTKKNGPNSFAICDAGMNDLLRPALYEAWQDIVPVREQNHDDAESIDIVGPICESADFLGRKRKIHIQSGDLLAVLDAGAYGFSMSSNYNTRPRPAEIMVKGARSFTVRRREPLEHLIGLEQLPPA